MARSTTVLPAGLATTSMASRMGTPEEIMVPSVRVKRATATLRIRSLAAAGIQEIVGLIGDDELRILAARQMRLDLIGLVVRIHHKGGCLW